MLHFHTFFLENNKVNLGGKLCWKVYLYLWYLRQHLKPNSWTQQTSELQLPLKITGFFFAKRACCFATQEKTSEHPQPKCFFKYLSRLVRPLHLIPNQKNHRWKRSSFAQHLPPRSRLAIWSIRQRPGRFSMSISFSKAAKIIYVLLIWYLFMSYFCFDLSFQIPRTDLVQFKTSRTSKVMVSAPSEWQDWCIAKLPCVFRWYN